MTKFEPLPYCFRMDGRVEIICEHGVGHTIFEPYKANRTGKWAYSHGGDGCCDGGLELLNG